jgi:hypothetical protein
MRSPFGRRALTVDTIPRARGKVERPARATSTTLGVQNTGSILSSQIDCTSTTMLWPITFSSAHRSGKPQLSSYPVG